MSTVKRLYRSRNERMLAGVAGGIGEYFSIDPTLVRLIFVLTALFGGPGLIAYVILWIIVPEEPGLGAVIPPEPVASTPPDETL